jgi:hypothetical protein
VKRKIGSHGPFRTPTFLTYLAPVSQNST